MKVSERQLEDELIEKLAELKYVFRDDIYDRATLERNFREKFQALNRVKLEEGEFQPPTTPRSRASMLLPTRSWPSARWAR